MKTYHFTRLSLVLLFITTLFSCSKKEENVPLQGGGNFANLVLSSDSSDNVLVVNEMVSFMVVGDDAVEYTNDAVFYVNQTEISGTSYVFDMSGSYDVYATHLGVTSNTLSFDVIEAAERTVLIDNKKALRNQTTTFTMVDADGIDVTSEAVFFVNNTEIIGNTYISATAGSFDVYAEYEVSGITQTTETKTFNVFIPRRKVVLEDYTGTWCGYCPSVAAAIVDAHNATSHISVVAIHETANSSPDPYHFPQVDLLQAEFGVTGLPAARINRNITWSDPYAVSEVTAMAGEETDLAIAIDSQLSGSTLSVEVSVIYENGSVPGDKLVVYLTEDGLIHDQTNYYDQDPTSPFYMMGNPIPDFVHNEVLRLSLSDIFGDEITATNAFDTYTKTFSVSIPSDYNTQNLHLVAMVVSSDNSARNSQHAAVNEDKEFE
jgi:thiol-disulfide isomerase/thioredoxin